VLTSLGKRNTRRARPPKIGATWKIARPQGGDVADPKMVATKFGGISGALSRIDVIGEQALPIRAEP
jgi:hypothetical protein